LVPPWQNRSKDQLGGGVATSSKTKRFEREAAKCRRLLGKAPKDFELLLHLSAIENALDRPAEALECLEKALVLRPESADAWRRYAEALLAQKNHEDAARAFRRTIELNPRDAEACFRLGIALTECGKQSEAVEPYMRALSIRPDYPEVLNNLGSILENQGKLAEAGECLQRAVVLNPRSAEGIYNLGVVRYRLGHLDEAALLFRNAIALKPDFPDAFGNLSMVLRLQNEFEESMVCCKRALALRRDHPEALMNFASLLHDFGLVPQAISVLERGLSLRSDCPDFHLNMGMLLLAAGRFEEGWREYEWRWEGQDLSAIRPAFAQPLWRGEAAEGRVLLLYAEQGFGDTIQFCRFAPLAAARGLRVVLLAQPALVRLLGSLPGVEKIVSRGQPLPPFDFQSPLMSLPLTFGTRLESIPSDIPYLAAEKDAVLAWRGRLPNDASEDLKVGLVWAGSCRRHAPHLAATDRRRSIAPEMLTPLLNVRGVQFYSLQKDGPSAPAEFGLIDLMNECRDFADTAALLAGLDLIISVDTAVVHLAGALGKPVWVLNRFDSCWRWLRNREDSPWYPTLRLFRQPRPGDWESVIARVRDELERCIVMGKAALSPRQ